MVWRFIRLASHTKSNVYSAMHIFDALIGASDVTIVKLCGLILEAMVSACLHGSRHAGGGCATLKLKAELFLPTKAGDREEVQGH